MRMKSNSIFLFSLALCSLLFSSYALPVGANVTAGTPVTLGTTTAGTADAWGGNITQVNLTINSSTLHWQGFYGSVTGSLRLASGNESNVSTLKLWTVSTLRGQIYASRASNIDFTVLNSTAVTLAAVDSAFSFLSGANDAAVNTGTDSLNPAFSIGQYAVGASTAPLITTLNSTGQSMWQQVVLNDGNTSDSSRYVFVGIINNSGVAYNGQSANFQIIVPENSVGDATPTTYYFYGEVQ
ncbi:MAG: hypothetical protein V1728_04865 [Candidatus Micrarchaeota archaeon]